MAGKAKIKKVQATVAKDAKKVSRGKIIFIIFFLFFIPSAILVQCCFNRDFLQIPFDYRLFLIIYDFQKSDEVMFLFFAVYTNFTNDH